MHDGEVFHKHILGYLYLQDLKNGVKNVKLLNNIVQDVHLKEYF
jgi:hypothetical protein